MKYKVRRFPTRKMSDRVRIHAAFTLHSFLGVTIRGSVVVHTRRLCSQHAWACSDAVVFKYRRGYPALVSSGLRRYSVRKYRVRWRTRPPSTCYYRRFQTSQSSHILACRRRLGISGEHLSLIHISEPTRLGMISYAVFCLKKKK